MDAATQARITAEAHERDPVRRGYLDQQLLDRAPTLADKVRVLEQLGERGGMKRIGGDLRVIHQRWLPTTPAWAAR